jgi:hypothetical protein
MKLALATVLAMIPSAALAAPLVGGSGTAFPKGTGAFEVNAAYVQPIRFSDDHFYGANVAGYYYFGDEVAVGAELEGYFVDQVRDDTALGGASVVIRWHFLAQDRFSLFVDAAFGVSYAEAAVPEGGTHYNYTPKGGGGATFELRDNLHLIGGLRFFHLSNANLHGRENNPSQDGVQYFVGLLWTF